MEDDAFRVDLRGESHVDSPAHGQTAGEPSVRKLWLPHPGDVSGHVSESAGFLLYPRGINSRRSTIETKEASNRMSILWIILIVILVLALLGFFSRGRW